MHTIDFYTAKEMDKLQIYAILWMTFPNQKKKKSRNKQKCLKRMILFEWNYKTETTVLESG